MGNVAEKVKPGNFNDALKEIQEYAYDLGVFAGLTGAAKATREMIARYPDSAGVLTGLALAFEGQAAEANPERKPQ